MTLPQNLNLNSEALHLTQSGVSQQIRALEEAIGARLFDRVNRELFPTAAAKFMI